MINLHESKVKKKKKKKKKISTKEWDRAGIELATPGSAVRHASVARHVTDCATRPGVPGFRLVSGIPILNLSLLAVTCHLLITFANSLDPDQDRLNVSPDLDPNCLTL